MTRSRGTMPPIFLTSRVFDSVRMVWADRKGDIVFHKIVNVAALTADLMPGVLAIIGGTVVIVASATGALWH